MVKEIPDAKTYRNAGIDYLNLGWGIILGISLDFHESDDDCSNRPRHKAAEEYYERAYSELVTAIALAQQGAEFLLKSKIALVSPWLLLSQNPKDYPPRSSARDVNFSEFRTIDAQDLTKVHDTVCSEKLSEDFKLFFDDLRKQRNLVIHAIKDDLDVSLKKGVSNILEISRTLLPDENWIEIRTEYLANDRHSVMYSNYTNAALIREYSVLFELLPKSTLRKYFDIPKDGRLYSCPICGMCEEAYGSETYYARLSPNTPNSKRLYCLVCNDDIEIERNGCYHQDCKGNVEYEGHCLTCGREQI